MKIQFIYPESGYNRYNNITLKNGRYYHGIGQLSAYLKEKGHETDLIHIVMRLDKNDLIRKIRSFDPDIICLSSTTHMMYEIVAINDILKDEFPEKLKVIGGIAISIEPELIDRLKGFELAIIGDGEIALEQIIERLENDQHDMSDIPNVIRNSREKEGLKVDSYKDLDSLPFADREIFDFEETDDYKIFKRLPMITSRGCRYSCSFCSNSVLRKYYEKGQYLRFRTPEDVCGEIKECLQKYPDIRTIQFQSDLFFDNSDWLKRFVEEYSDILLPYHVLMRVEQVNEQNIELLKNSGCIQILMGVESGNKDVRRSIGKMSSTDKFLKAFNIIKSAGINVGTFNMMGFHNETVEDVLDGIYLNSVLEPDLIQVSIYYPYKNTRLFDTMESLIEKKVYHTYFERSLLKKEYLIDNFYYYFRNYEYIMRFYREKKDESSFFLWDRLLRYALIPEKVLRGYTPDTFRILF